MAVKTKETKMGNYITKVNNYDIRMKISYKKEIRGRESVQKQVETHEFIVCRGKTVFENGFKTKGDAVEYAKNAA